MSDDLPGLIESRFPVSVTLPDGSGRQTVLVAWTDERVLVYTHPQRVVFDEPWDPAGSWAGSRQVDWTIATAAGVLTVHPGFGCGCGNPLKRFTLSRTQRVGVSVKKTVAQAKAAA